VVAGDPRPRSAQRGRLRRRVIHSQTPKPYWA
jgi:hypothetical protein